MAEQIGSNRAKFTFAEVMLATGASSTNDGGWHSESSQICGVTSDSRAVETENLFVALRGERFDGHNFLESVWQDASAAIVEQFDPKFDAVLVQFVVPDTLVALGDLARFHRQKFEIPVVAVTGSYGKTSTRALIGAALPAGGETLTSQANFNNEIGLPMTLFQLEKQHQFATVEMGMRGLKQIDYLAKIALPTVGVITNIGPQHIELLGDLENIANAKAELIENLPADGLAILPADSPFLPMLRGKAPCRVVTFGLARDADYRVTEVETRENGNVSCSVNFKGGTDVLFQSGLRQNQRLEEDVSSAEGKFAVQLPLPGAHNAINAAAAFAVAHQLGVAPDAIVAALQTAQLPGARMRVIQTESLTIIDDCYNAGPDSMRAALQTLRDFPSNGRRVAVLGAMRELGEFSDEEHRKIGELAGSFVYLLLGVGEETQPLLNVAVETAKKVENQLSAFWNENAAEAAQFLGEAMSHPNGLKAGDIVLVKGSRSVGLEVIVKALQTW